MKATLATAVLAVLTSCATPAPAQEQPIDELRTEARAAAVADGVSTLVVLGTGVGVEANPFMPSTPAGILLVTAAKALAPSFTDNRTVLKMLRSLWGGFAAGNNTCVLLGPASTVCLSFGALLAVYLWFREGEIHE